MGLQSALTTSLTGLQAAETTIDVVGNNVANSNTVGFKESNTVFATQFLQTISIGSAPSTNGGGTNPRQIGLGVKVAQITPDFTQGTIEISSSPLDLAIQGDGFLIVQDGTNQLFTRNGQLQLNSENEVVTSTGQRVLGYTVNDEYEVLTDNLVPLSIDLGAERVAQATSTATFTGVLNPAVDAGELASVSQSIVLGDGLIERPMAMEDTSFNAGDVTETEEPIISSVTNSAGAGLTGPGTGGDISYKVVFYDADGYEATPSSDITVSGHGGGELVLDSLPVESGEFVGRRIYRTEAGVPGTYYLVDDTTGSTTTFNDTVDEADLGTTITTTLDETVLDAGSYSYYITYYDVDSGTETRPSPLVGPETVDTGGGRVRIDFSDLETPDPSFDSIRIYRNLVNGSEFYRIDQIDIADDSYIDQVTDATISEQITDGTAEVVNLDGPPSEDDTLLTDVVIRNGSTYETGVFQVGTLTFSAEKDGVDLDEKTLQITAETTVLDFVNFIEEASGIDTDSDVSDTEFPDSGGTPGVQLVDGQIVITSNLGEENAITVPLTAFRLVPEGSTAPQTISLSFTETQAADGPGTSTEMIVYDSLGLPLGVRITTVLEEKTSNSTVYRWYASSSENEPIGGVSTVVGNGLLEFDTNGDLISATQDRISVQRNTTASETPLEVQLDFSLIKSLGETDAQGNPVSSLNFASQDGFQPGVLTDFIITDDGLIQGQFSNGTQRTVGQIVMARFANNAGLSQVGDSLFDVGVNSGEPLFGTPGEDGIGTLTAGAVELSNTDVGQNLIELILASTQYRAGSRVITTSQELLDELLALRR